MKSYTRSRWNFCLHSLCLRHSMQKIVLFPFSNFSSLYLCHVITHLNYRCYRGKGKKVKTVLVLDQRSVRDEDEPQVETDVVVDEDDNDERCDSLYYFTLHHYITLIYSIIFK